MVIIRFVDLSYSGLYSVTSLNLDWKHLEVIDLMHNFIKNFEGWPSSLPFLEKLLLKGNFIRDLEGMPQNLPRLEWLDLSENKLENLNGFPVSLPNLKYLNLHDNNLTSLKGLNIHISSLENFSIDNNPIETFTDVPYAIISEMIPFLSLRGMKSFNLSDEERELLEMIISHPQSEASWKKLTSYYQNKMPKELFFKKI